MIFHTGKSSVVGAGFLLACLALGCGGTGNISGKVTYKGELVPFGRVTFFSQTGKQLVFSATIRAGSYSVAGVPAGPVIITVRNLPIAPQSKTRKGLAPAVGIHPPGAEEDPYANVPLNPPKEDIPKSYADPRESGLTYTVTAGNQEHDLNLVGP